MIISPNQSFSSLQFEPVVLNRSMPCLQNYPDRVPKRKSRGKMETRALDGAVPLSHRLLSALIIQDGSETADSIAMLEDELSHFSSKYSQRTLEERTSLELRNIGLLMDAVGDQENNGSSHKPGTSKAGKKAGLDVAKRTGRNCFNKLTSSDVVLSEPVCSKDANCIDDIGSGTSSNANVDSHDRRLGSWASVSSGATPINEKPALGPKVGTHQFDKIVACMPEQTLAKSVVLTDTSSVLRAAPTLNEISRIPKRKRTTRGRKLSEVRNTTSANAGSLAPSNGRGIPKRKRTTRGRKRSEVRNTTSANAGSSAPSNGRGESEAKAKRKRKMIRLSSLGSGLENIKETSPVGVKQKKTQKKNTKAKSSAKTKIKAKEKVDQLSASGSGLGSIAETPSSSSPSSGPDSIAETPSSSSPSKGESGEPVSTGATGVNEEAGLVFPRDWSCLDIDGLSSLEIPDDIESWLVDGLSVEAELRDRIAFLEIPMDDLLNVNLCFRRE